MTTEEQISLKDGIRALVRQGDGEAVLWFHGYTMNSSVWQDIWSLLPEWHHIGIDLPGHGASRPLSPSDDLDAIADVIADLALAHGVRHLVALSFGTIIALQAAIRRPDAFASVVLSAPAVLGGPHEVEVEARYVELARLYHQKGPGPHMTELWMRSPPDIFRGVNGRPELGRRLATVIDRHSWEEMANFAMRGLTVGRQGLEELARISSSTLVLLGSDDLPAFRLCGQLISAAVPNCHEVEVPGAGHLALLEEPEACASIIDAHLRSASPADPPAAGHAGGGPP